jgi:Spy/CpxP family protein refolding chaperone
MKLMWKAAIAGLLGAATLAAAIVINRPPIALADGPRVFEELNLTAAQRSELEALFDARRAEVEALLSDDQKEAFATALAEDPYDFRAAFRAANLTEDQRSAVREIMQGSRESVADILTADQRQQIRETAGQRHGQRGGPGQRGNIVEALAELDLTEAQRNQIEAIFANSRSQVEALLSAEQRTAFADTLAETQDFREAMQAANLTEDQRATVREIMQGSRDDIAAVLTEEQLAQLRDGRGDRPGRGGEGFPRDRGGRGNGPRQ